MSGCVPRLTVTSTTSIGRLILPGPSTFPTVRAKLSRAVLVRFQLFLVRTYIAHVD